MTVIEQPGPRQRSASAWAQVRAFAALHRSVSIIIGMVLVGIGLPILASVPPLSAFQPFNAWLDGFSNAGTFVLLAVGLNIVVGLAGLLDLGYAAFFAFGAYAYAYGASPFSGNAFPFLPMLVVGAIVAATFGVLLGAPTLRLRGDYLAIVTLGFGEIVPIVFLNAEPYTNASKLTVVSPDQFYFQVSFTVLTMIVLGGQGNIWGVALGAFIIANLQQTVLKQLNIFFQAIHFPAINLGLFTIDLQHVNFTEYQFLLYGVALVLMMLLRPEGLFPSGRRRRELHSAEDSAGEALVVDPAAPTGGLV